MHEISLHISVQPLMNLEAFIKIKKKKKKNFRLIPDARGGFLQGWECQELEFMGGPPLSTN